MLDFNKTLKLFINGEEYDFANDFTFSFHPTNFSSFTFNDVIKKSNNVFPKNIIFDGIDREFSFCELYQNDNLIFFGILNDTGRFSLFPNTIKTKSITVSDFRKWLSLLKPINKFWFNVSPTKIVNDVVSILNEEKIQVGNLDFTNDDYIKAYNSEGKTAYQILKNVITKQSNSMLFFSIKDNKILVNYKSNQAFLENSPIILNINDQDFLKKYKILDIEFENETLNYANYLRYDSENLISNKPNIKKDIDLINENINLEFPIYKIDNTIEKTFITTENGLKKVAVFLNNKNNNDGKFYDFKYSSGSTTLNVNKNLLNNGEKLTITYYTKSRVAYESFNNNEINEISRISKTNGIVYQYEKFNDISNPSDLIKMLKSDVEAKAIRNNVLVLTSGEPIWNILDSVNVVAGELSGVYLVHEISGSANVSGDIAVKTYSYTLKKSKNTDNFLNQFDNQSFKDQPIYDENNIIKTLETFTNETNIIFNNTFLELKDTPISKNLLQSEIQTNLLNSEVIKYKIMEVNENE